MKDKTNLTGLNPDNFRSVINGKDTGLYILRNGSGMEMCVTNYGAIVLSIMAPDSHGKFENVVIGFDIITYSLTLFLILCTVVITVFTRWCGKHSNRVKTNFSSVFSMPMEKPVFRAMLR